MKWFDQNPYGENPSLYQSAKWQAHKFGRNQFASNFARRGMSSVAFGLTPGERFRNQWRGPIKHGSNQHVRNLEFMVSKDPDNPVYANALKQAKADSGNIGKLASRGSKLLKYGVPVAGTILPMFTTPGGPKEKIRATAGGAVGALGWIGGAKLGAASGAAVGGIVGAAVGGLVGGFAGAIGLDEGFQALTRIPDKMVDRERNRRQLDWVNSNAAFMTRNAATMRQQSLALMNRGMMTSRSALGREAVIMHR